MSGSSYYLCSLVSLVVLSGFVGLHHLIIAGRRRDLGVHRMFGLLALCLAFHDAIEVARQVVPHDPLLITDRLQWAAEIAAVWLLIAFIARITGTESGRILRWLAVVLAAFLVPLLLRPGGFAYLEVHGWSERTMPWGEVLRVVSGRFAPTYYLFLLVVLATFIWNFRAAWASWRRTRRGSHLALLASLVVVLLAIAHSVVRDLTGMAAVPVFDHAFVLLCLVMSTVLADEVAHAAGLRERMLNADRLESLGRMAGGIAHDFNNLLTGVVGGADLLRQHLKGQPALAELAEVIVQSGERAAGLARRLRDFSRGRGQEAGPVDVHQILNDVAQLLKFGLGRRVAIHARYDAPRALVQADASALTSLFLNLGINARDAMSQGGTLGIGTSLASPTPTQRGRLMLPLAGDQHLQITVTDTGIGMDAEVQRRLLEPFFTTKGPEGTGLGLFQVAEILREIGGSLHVESAPGKGATFSIWLPLLADGRSQDPQASALERQHRS